MLLPAARLLVLLAAATAIAAAAVPSTCISALDGSVLHLDDGRLVNDDFCDCVDGADEPSTSACSHVVARMFLCENQGLLPVEIHSGRVHDGVCDCCDGSDEPVGHCRNVCRDEIEQRRRAAADKLVIVEAGVAERQRRLSNLKADDTKKKAEVETHRVVLRELKDLRRKVQMFLDREARREYELQVAAAKEKELSGDGKCLPSEKKVSPATAPSSTDETEWSSPPPPSIPDDDAAVTQAKVKRLLAHAVVYHESGDWMSLRAYMRDVIDAAKRSPVRTAWERRREDFLGPLFNGGREGQVKFITFGLQGIGLVLSPLRGGCEAVWWAQYYSTSLLYTILPSSLLNMWQSFLDLVDADWRYQKSLFLRRLSQGRFFWWHFYASWAWDTVWEAPVVMYKYLFPPRDQSVVLAEAESLRKVIKDIDADMGSSQKAIDDLTAADSVDYGKCCRILKNACVVAQFEKYMYKVCPFDQVLQDTTRLGKWKQWDDDGSTMLFDDGERCWSGPNRSVRVVLECGAVDKILRVEELSTCTYTITMTTPAMCSQKLLEDMHTAARKWNTAA
ncbi:Aste57867_14470 [Aphanomyces stellatus]|uniref:Glucosidase 2 subunit beta n=1 Tax=Aphanomyces stellatus TaxID=120398 RepID=A0A485L2F4_9STRA|nr:hypothetical protein As57867_014416 [Aphanomyces stellatus]VFT91292.1 Aste57867_14470 [Aphanomyces stellatus]